MAEPVRFYFDQHVQRSLARALRARGVDVLTAQDAGRCGLPDPDQLAFATAEERVMMTFDTDYLALHYAGTQHAGIAWCQKRKYTVGELLGALTLLHGVLSRDEMRNQVEYL
ncbi:MAG: DUF5615 family PIN-like protein [Pirellulales bacterium]